MPRRRFASILYSNTARAHELSRTSELRSAIRWALALQRSRGMQKTEHGQRTAPQLLAADRTPISEIMTPAPVTVRPELALDDLMTLFLDQNISRAPVVDETGKLIGLISKTDLLVDAYLRGDTDVDQRGDAGHGSHVHEVGNIVRDVMTPVAYSLTATTSIGAAARRMLADNVHAAPVVSETGQVTGMLSATDVLAWVAGV